MPAKTHRPQPTEPELRTRLASLRLFALPVSVLPVLIATAIALPVGAWRVDVLVAAAVATALLHTAGNLLNDYFDYLRGVDRIDEDDENRPGRQLVRGQMTPAQFRNQALACLALAALPVGLLVVWVSPWVLLFGLAAGLGLYAYTGPPLELKYRAMGEVLVFCNFGPVLMLGAAWVQTRRFEPQVLLLAIPVGMATAAILTGNNVRDRREDAEAGIRTLAHLGRRARPARALYVLLAAGSAGLLAALAIAGLAPGPLVLSPVLLVLLAGPVRAVLAGRRLSDIDAATARFTSIQQAAILLVFVA
jgi:1,4-dihydroxy-2-naphthoate octaprenyltransferase